MPEIPGVAADPSSGGGTSGALKVVGALAVLAVVLFLAGRWFTRPKSKAEATTAEPPAQIELPPTPPDPTASLPISTAKNPGIAPLSHFSKPWSVQEFIFRDRMTGENIPALVVRLPGGNPGSTSGYWAISLKAPYGDCKLEFITDPGKLRDEYGFDAARHPMIGNPCSRSVFDPTRMANLPGDIWVRGAIVQGSDLRPPLNIETKIEGKDLVAIRME